MAEFQTTERHGHPALDIGGQEDERPIFDNVFEPRIQGFEDKIEVGLMGEDVYQLWTRSGEGIGSSALEHSRGKGGAKKGAEDEERWKLFPEANNRKSIIFDAMDYNMRRRIVNCTVG